MRTLAIASATMLLLSAVSAQRDAKPDRPAGEAKVLKRQGGYLGITFVEKAHADRPALEITAVLAGSDAESLGFRRGDVITAVDGREFANGDKFIEMLWMAGLEPPTGDEKVEHSITIVRDGTEQKIAGGLRELDAHPAVGEKAPDFTLADADGKNEVTLSKLCGKNPVVLVFGSYTWPPFRRQSGTVEELYQSYGDRAEFLFVYIREAHPADSNWADPRLQIDDPSTLAERRAVATTCSAKLELTLPMVVDDMADSVNQAYRAWPERIYVIDRDGEISYKGGIGPFGYSPAEAEKALAMLLKR